MAQCRYRVVEVANRFNKETGGVGTQTVTFQNLFDSPEGRLSIDQIAVCFTILLVGANLDKYKLGQIVTLSLE